MIAEADGAELRPVAWNDVGNWGSAATLPAYAVWRASAAAIAAGQSVSRAAQPPSSDLALLCRRVAAMPTCGSDAEARRFFEHHFEPFTLRPADSGGFLTGYYEPVLDGDVNRSQAFAAPVLDRPAGESLRRWDRAEWESFALTPEAKPVVWLRDWTEVFLVHVQGSARVRLRDGSMWRLAYAGRNGAPYTSIGRRLVETGRLAAGAMSLDRLKGWLRSHGQELGGEARSLMQENKSYIFFRREPDPGDDQGPIGGQGLPLHAGVSIAVDRSLWSYGLPFWIATPGAIPGFGPVPLRRLFVAQDTGSAIIGRARADLFLGSGEAAGEAAGRIRHAASFTVLLPRARA